MTFSDLIRLYLKCGIKLHDARGEKKNDRKKLKTSDPGPIDKAGRGQEISEPRATRLKNLLEAILKKVNMTGKGRLPVDRGPQSNQVELVLTLELPVTVAASSRNGQLT